MTNPKIAVLTTCQDDFKRYKESQPKNIRENLCKISVLRDIQEKEYNKAVLILGSKNVTDFVINRVTEMSLFVEDLKYEIIYK